MKVSDSNPCSSLWLTDPGFPTGRIQRIRKGHRLPDDEWGQHHASIQWICAELQSMQFCIPRHRRPPSMCCDSFRRIQGWGALSVWAWASHTTSNMGRIHLQIRTCNTLQSSLLGIAGITCATHRQRGCELSRWFQQVGGAYGYLIDMGHCTYIRTYEQIATTI